MPKASQTKVADRKDFPKQTYRRWYESMLLMRRFEEKCAQLYGRQKIRGFCHLYMGQEACAAGVSTALGPQDKYITAYRDHALPLCLGTPAKAVMAELYGKATGASKGKGGSMHIFDKAHHFFGGHGIVGGQIPLGVGIAFAEKYNHSTQVCITFLGDGAVRQGAFHEALNLAMHLRLPIIFAIENNGYAMGTSVERSSNVRELYKLGEAYKMPAQAVDGMRVEEVHRAVATAATRARKGEGCTLLELNTYRYKGHSMSDPAHYRSKAELAAYREKDPISQLQNHLLRTKICAQKELDEIAAHVKAQVEEAVTFAEESPFPPKEEAFSHVYVQENDHIFTKD